MEQLIKALLLTNKTIVLPKIGALTLTDESQMEIMLLTYLKYDNGELKKAYERQENCDSKIADEKVNEWLEQAINTIEQGQKFYIGNLGYLFINKENEYAFNSHKEEDTETIGTANPENETKEEIVDDIHHPDLEETPVASTVSEIDNQETCQPNTEEIDANKKEKEPINSDEKFTTSADEINNEKKAIGKTQEKKSNVKTQKKKNHLTLIILCCIILICGILGGIYYDKINDYFHFTSNVEKTYTKNNQLKLDNGVTNSTDQSEQLKSEEKTETSPTPKSPQNTKVTPAKENSSTTLPKEKVKPNTDIKTGVKNPVNNAHGDYYVIVGAFAEDNNATRLLEKLKNNGYDASIIHSGTLNLVSIGNFNSLQEASQLRENIGNCWILKK